ncbi:calcium-binding protein [Phenylobacterium sp.]|uniref:calcium-binding protein n=1 Tax=Phenylobacterium sp. TaxID=1871053 RepID=UPI002B945258|nr:calcium-binding protein [Phenylobacterium sp.]HVI30914.1 calcium-binding protein [Phenylobacterium sp.]
MTTVTAGPSGMDFENLKISDLLLGDPITQTETRYVLKDGDWTYEFTGQFTYTAGEISDGTVTGWRETFKGEVTFDASGFSVPLATGVGWAETNANETARSTILAGADNLIGSAAADRMYGYAGNDTIEGGAGRDYLRGHDGDDVIRGGADFDDVHGNAGNDTVHGGLGDDWVVGGKDNDVQYGDEGWDIVYGNLGADTVSGGADSDWVRGGQDNDSVSGGAGDDWLAGDKGDDTISGGTGADLFHTHGDAGIDRVLDFSRAEGDRVNVLPGTTYSTAQVGGDVVITMGGGGQMVLVGVQLSSLTGDWIFGA